MATRTNDDRRAFDFLRVNDRPAKPRVRGMTEIRGPYYSPMGKRYLTDLLETMGNAIDALKFAGGSFSLMRRGVVRELIDLCRANGVRVSTGGFVEHVLTQGHDAVRRYLAECRELGFDMVEVSSGFITLPPDDFVRLVEDVQKAGLKAKAEVGILYGAGGATAVAEIAAEGIRDAGWAIGLARRCLDAGADHIMLESEGITENVEAPRTDVIARVVDGLGLEEVMFEAADPAVFAWYVKTYGPDINLFVDHSQIVQLECLRAGIWGTKSLWGRVRTYNPTP
jgi:phosphosulfolactate synthase (CoM biosynthesis protein A)